jgi:hypothetical protein
MKSATLAAGSFLAVTGTAAVVLTGGHLASFDDSVTLGDSLVAGGTLALAGVTFWLAWQTRREVGLSVKGIEIAREGIDAQDMPFVIASQDPNQSRALDAFDLRRLWWSTGPNGGWLLQVRLWNIGRGPAIARDIRLQAGGDDFLGARAAEIGEIVIEAGQVHDLILPVAIEESAFSSEDLRGAMRIYYSHIDGTEYMTTSLALIADRGVRVASFKRLLSDGKGRPIV